MTRRHACGHWGRLEGDEIVLDSGERVPEAEATYLAPVEPSKILAVHLTYRSRVDEYVAAPARAPAFFVKPPNTLNGHRGVLRRPAGAKFLNYEGELAVVVGRRMKGVPEAEALELRRRLPARQRRRAARLPPRRPRRDAARQGPGRLPADGPELVPASEFDPTDFTLRTS